MNNNFKQLVIVCRNIEVNWNYFINPIYIGVESGVIPLIKKKFPIKFICGDFDSITQEENAFINQNRAKLDFPLIKFDSEKDYIDAELAIIEAIKQKIAFNQIVLISEGDRWDMIFAQINLLNKYAQYKPIFLTTNNYAFSLQENQTHIFTKEQLQYHYISLFPLNCQEVVYNFKGCKYYSNEDIRINNYDILAISNEFNNEINQKEILIKKGQCLVILYKNK